MFFKERINPLDRKRLAKYFGMPFSNESLPESIKNIFYIYYIPEEKESYSITSRKEAAFFGLTLMCALNRDRTDGDYKIESRFRMMMNTSDTDKRRLESIFRSNITTSSELITTLGLVCKKDANLKYLYGVDINSLMIDLIDFSSPYKNDRVRQKWAMQMFNLTEE